MNVRVGAMDVPWLKLDVMPYSGRPAGSSNYHSPSRPYLTDCLESQLAAEIATLCVHSMVHHSKTWSVKQAAETLRAQGLAKKGVKFPD